MGGGDLFQQAVNQSLDRALYRDSIQVALLRHRIMLHLTAWVRFSAWLKVWQALPVGETLVDFFSSMENMRAARDRAMSVHRQACEEGMFMVRHWALDTVKHPRPAVQLAADVDAGGGVKLSGVTTVRLTPLHDVDWSSGDLAAVRTAGGTGHDPVALKVGDWVFSDGGRRLKKLGLSTGRKAGGPHRLEMPCMSPDCCQCCRNDKDAPGHCGVPQRPAKSAWGCAACGEALAKACGVEAADDVALQEN